jgi:hypothetical protein
MASTASHRSPLSNAIPQSINLEDVDMTTEPSCRPAPPPSDAAEHRLGRG